MRLIKQVKFLVFHLFETFEIMHRYYAFFVGLKICVYGFAGPTLLFFQENAGSILFIIIIIIIILLLLSVVFLKYNMTILIFFGEALTACRYCTPT